MSYNITSSRFQSFCLTNPQHDLLDLSPDWNTDRDPYRVPVGLSPTANADAWTLTGTNDARTRIPDHPSIPYVELEHDIGMQSSNDTAQCCCGRPSCAYLEHNNAALGGLEKDLETAARLGQVNATLSICEVIE